MLTRWAAGRRLLSPLLLGAVLIGLATRSASSKRSGRAASNARLRKLAEEVAKDPATAEWVESARQAVAEGTLGPPLDADELRARIAGLRAGDR